MLPSTLYQQKIAENSLIPDTQQQEIVTRLDACYHHLLSNAQASGLLYYLGLKKLEQVKGLYLWGSVGIGKSMLIDLFYESIDFIEKKRLHYLDFMRTLHQALHKQQGKKNPLQCIATQWAKTLRVLCIDEFFVDDTGDAMVLAEFLPVLLSQGVCFLTSSNCAPDQLYADGFQRDRFLPIIALIKQHTDVLALENKHDYRLRQLAQAGTYHTPITDQTNKTLQQLFHLLTHGNVQHNTYVEIMNRKIPVVCVAKDTVWLEFSTLCATARSQQDYLALSEQFSTIFVSNIPVIPDNKNDIMLRFILMIDVFYDAHIQCVCSAEATAQNLYKGNRFAFEYQRTVSRLIEMQSCEWFSPPR